MEKIYIEGIQNESFTPGIEPMLIQALSRSLLTIGSVKLVQQASQADAIISGRILRAQYTGNILYGSGDMYPKTISVAKALIATEYIAILECEFSLRRADEPSTNDALFRQTFLNSKRFAGSNQKASYGTTSSLVNESEFTRAVGDMSVSMMRDVQEALVSRF